MDSAENRTKFSCRICGEDGHYDLAEMKFRYNDSDVMLIDAFNSFSMLNNESVEIYLCEVCTDSLTVSYSFLQQIRQSDEKFLKDSENEIVENREQDTIMIVDCESVEPTERCEHLEETSPKTTPTKRKIRQTKSKLSSPSEPNEKKLGVNIALPHFMITNFASDDLDQDIDKNDDTDAQSDSESYRKKIKTLKPSAVITGLDQINEMCRSPMEIDGDIDAQSIYKCSHCPKAFAAPHHLMIHMRKSHMCQYCLATFSKINDLYSHVKQMHQTFDCLLCSKEFQSNGNLRQHMRKNHSIFLPAHISLLNISDANQ